MNDPRTSLFPDLAPQRPLLIAGPCSAETEPQVLAAAHALAARGVRIYRAGLWKPRTKPGSFEGVGVAGLPWLRRVKRETGMYLATEASTREQVEAALAGGIDLLWIGARTASDPFAMQQIADALRGRDLPVLVKNPPSPDLELWIGALERIRNAGIRRLGAIHRGFTSLDPSLYRNPPMWALPIELRRRMPELPILCDPSHIGGRRDRIAPLAQQALDLGFDGLIVEAHCTPDEAWSDRDQQLTPAELGRLVEHLTLREQAPATENLSRLRDRLDRLDDRLLELLAQRMEVARAIGRYKKDHGLPVLQPHRYEQLLERRAAQAAQLGMDPACMRSVLRAIHEESVRQQLQLPEGPENLEAPKASE